MLSTIVQEHLIWTFLRVWRAYSEIERMSQNSPFSVDEYPMSMGSPFSVEEYCDSTPNTESPSPLALSHEFSINEYDYNEDLTYEEKGIEATTSVVSVAHTM